jgi:hypothetical protein
LKYPLVIRYLARPKSLVIKSRALGFVMTTAPIVTSPANRPRVGFGCLDLSVLGRGRGHERVEQGGGGCRYLVDGPVEDLSISSRGLREAA